MKTDEINKETMLMNRAALGFDRYLESVLDIDGVISDGEFFANKNLKERFNEFDVELKNGILAFAKRFYLKGCYDMNKLMEIE